MRAIALGLCALVLGLAIPANAFHADHLPLVYADAVTGDGAWGVRATNTGPMVMDLSASGAYGAELSGAVFITDAAGNVQFGFAFTGHVSPDRQIIMVPGATDGTPPPGVSFTFDTQGTDAACTLFCLGVNFDAAGTQNMIVWVGGGSASTFEVRGAVGALAVQRGAAHVLGDPDFTGGVNVQVQHTVPTPTTPAYITARAGVKVMQDTGAHVEVRDRLYGFFGASDFKLVCEFRAGACLWASDVQYGVLNPTCEGIADCNLAQISWSGPGGSGETGYGTYAFLGLGPGGYDFTVDQKVDVYGPSIYDPASGAWLFLGENSSYLTVADVRLP